MFSMAAISPTVLAEDTLLIIPEQNMPISIRELRDTIQPLNEIEAGRRRSERALSHNFKPAMPYRFFDILPG